jgi:hypothetical protein
MTDTLTRVVVYWAEAGDDRGWCYAVHYTRTDAIQSVQSTDTDQIPGSEDWSEAEAVSWVRANFGKAVSIEIGDDDLV